MTLHIEISGDEVERLRERAAAVGMDVTEYAAGVLRRAAERPLSVSEISGPIAEAFRASGLTEDQLTDMLEQAKHEMRARKRAS